MIYPASYQESNNSLAEKSLFSQSQILFGGSKDVDVFHSVRIAGIGPLAKDVEIDFVILTRDFALCIEVKGGNIGYNPEDGWSQNGHRIANPIDQVIEAKHRFIDRFKEDCRFLPVFWALGLPDMRMVSRSLPVALDDAKVMDSDSVRYLDKFLAELSKEVFSLRQRKDYQLEKSRQYARNHIRGVLLRQLGFEPTVDTKLLSDEIAFTQLLENQKEAIQAVHRNSRLLIIGPAGSGKTLVGMHQAYQQYELGANVLVLTYNRNLSAHLRFQVKSAYSPIDGRDFNVSSFHSFAKRTIETYSPGWFEENLVVDNQEFWDLVIPIKLSEVLELHEPSIDFLLLDEAQDFADLWFDVLKKVIKSTGKVTMLMDLRQDLFERGNSLLQNNFVRVDLPYVIRQTKTLTQFIAENLGYDLQPHRNCPEGLDVLDLRSAKEDPVVISALEKSGMLSRSAVILYESKHGLGILDRVKFSSVDIVRSGDVRNRRVINAVSINLFKGLEASVVIIPHFNELNEYQQYVAMSRAKSGLVLL
jgi:thymidine kinase